MRTSPAQFEMIIVFMEKNGDLSKPTGGVRGRQWCIKKWKELADILNSDGSGKSQSEDKWHKVWSDFKNNTKRKWAKQLRFANATGGGPCLKEKMSDLEQRALAIIGEQAAIGMNVPEAGFQQDDARQPPSVQPVMIPEEEVITSVITETPDGDWNTPGTSKEPTCFPPSEVPLDISPPMVEPTPPAARPILRTRRKRQVIETSNNVKYFVEAEKCAREHEREHDRMVHEIERERIRQRDTELQLQAQWLEFMKECLSVVKKYIKIKTEE